MSPVCGNRAHDSKTINYEPETYTTRYRADWIRTNDEIEIYQHGQAG